MRPCCGTTIIAQEPQTGDNVVDPAKLASSRAGRTGKGVCSRSIKRSELGWMAVIGRMEYLKALLLLEYALAR